MAEHELTNEQIATEVMGWTNIEGEWMRYTGNVFDDFEKTGYAADYYVGGVVNAPLFNPCEDYNHCWKVVVHMQADGWDYDLGSNHYEPTHHARFGRGDYNAYDNEYAEEYNADAPTPTHAICRAALAAKRAAMRAGEVGL